MLQEQYRFQRGCWIFHARLHLELDASWFHGSPREPNNLRFVNDLLGFSLHHLTGIGPAIAFARCIQGEFLGVFEAAVLQLTVL